jgi:hypothetical protein
MAQNNLTPTFACQNTRQVEGIGRLWRETGWVQDDFAMKHGDAPQVINALLNSTSHASRLIPLSLVK